LCKSAIQDLEKEQLQPSHKFSELEPVSSWLIVDEWEANQESFRNFDAVVYHLHQALQISLPGNEIEVMYLCGK
jgi:hypothetical protein